MAVISPEFIAEWGNLQGKSAVDFCFKKILPGSVKAIQKKGLPAEVAGVDWDCLVSLMGFSPETTILAASAIRPKSLVIVTSADTAENYDRAMKYLNTHKILKPHQIKYCCVNPASPRDIYDKITSAIKEIDPGSNRNVMVDVTGGKKIMSATAGQVGWELNAPLCYIDGEYNSTIRRPVPGTEQIIMLVNPSMERGRNARREALNTWKMRQFRRAEELFRESLRLNKDHLIEEIAIPLCHVFTALSDFKLNNLAVAADKLKKIASREYLGEIVQALNLNQTIEAFNNDPLLEKASTRTAAFLALADSYAGQQRYDFAVMLAYRALESAIQEGLRLAAGGVFDTGKPQWDKFNIQVDELQQEYIKLSKKVDKNSKIENALPHKLGLVNGFCILTLLDKNFVPSIFQTDTIHAVRWVRGTTDTRNSSILAHGSDTLGEKEYNDIAALAKKIAGVIMADHDFIKLVSDLCPPKLEQFDTLNTP